jgi:hypothetical protein
METGTIGIMTTVVNTVATMIGAMIETMIAVTTAITSAVVIATGTGRMTTGTTIDTYPSDFRAVVGTALIGCWSCEVSPCEP